MGPLWRLTRNRFGKRLHAVLDDAGITVSRLDEYRAPLPADDAASPPSSTATGPNRRYRNRRWHRRMTAAATSGGTTPASCGSE